MVECERWNARHVSIPMRINRTLFSKNSWRYSREGVPLSGQGARAIGPFFWRDGAFQLLGAMSLAVAGERSLQLRQEAGPNEPLEAFQALHMRVYGDLGVEGPNAVASLVGEKVSWR
jgi:hypothetical protein